MEKLEAELLESVVDISSIERQDYDACRLCAPCDNGHGPVEYSYKL